MALPSGRAWPAGRVAACRSRARGPRAGGRPVSRAGCRRGQGLAAWSGGQDPGAVAAGQAAAEQVAQVQRGGAALEPGVVPGHSAVAELEPASPPGGDLGDGALDVGPVCHVVLAQPGAGGPVRAGGAQQAVVLVQVQGAAVFGGGAPLAQRAVPAGGPEDDGVLGGDVPGDPGRAGHGPGGRIDGEVIGGEAALDGGQQRPGLDHRLVPGLGDRGAQVPGAVGRIAVPGKLPAAGIVMVAVTAAAGGGALGRHELRGDRRVGVLGPGGPGQLLIGDDPGLRVGGHVGAVAVPAGLGGLAGVPGLGVHGGDHPVFGDLAGDPPPPVGPVGALGGLDVLPGDQGQQRHRRRGRARPASASCQRRHQRVRVVHQRRDQRVLGRRVVPVDLRLARPGVVMPGAHRRDLLRRAGHLPRHPPDRRDQLGDGVLGGHRIGQDRGVHRPAPPALQDPGLLDHLPDRVVDPVRPRRLRDPVAASTPARTDRTPDHPAARRSPPSTARRTGPPRRSPGPNSHAAPARSAPRPSAWPAATAGPPPAGRTGPRNRHPGTPRPGARPGTRTCCPPGPGARPAPQRPVSCRSIRSKPCMTDIVPGHRTPSRQTRPDLLAFFSRLPVRLRL